MRINDTALVEAAIMSDRYIADRFLPDKAIDLIDEAAAKLKMEITSKPLHLDEIDRKVTFPGCICACFAAAASDHFAHCLSCSGKCLLKLQLVSAYLVFRLQSRLCTFHMLLLLVLLSNTPCLSLLLLLLLLQLLSFGLVHCCAWKPCQWQT